MMEKLLRIEELSVDFTTEYGTIHAVRGVSLELSRGETLAIVGESGCGKSVLCKSIIQTLSQRGKVTSGQILFEGKNLISFSQKEMEHLRGAEISMVFQDPMSSLTPTWTVGAQLVEAVRIHQRVSRKEAKMQALQLLDLVGIDNSQERFFQHPHQFSGGMRQRVVIAIALANNPKLLIADEPTTALDVTVQAQILELLKKLQTKLGLSILFITHDLGVVAKIADRVSIMYAGELVETGMVREVFFDPRHPYTWGLLSSLPCTENNREYLPCIPGTPPDLRTPPKGDVFAPRNIYAMKIDLEEKPPMFYISDTHSAATWLLHPDAPKRSAPVWVKDGHVQTDEEAFFIE